MSQFCFTLVSFLLAGVPILPQIKVFAFALHKPHFAVELALLNRLLNINVQSIHTYATILVCYSTFVVMPPESCTKK